MFTDCFATLPRVQKKLSELRHNYLVSPGGRDRHLYATLDDDFGQQEMEGGLTRHEYIDKDAPIQIINLRRIQWKPREKKSKNTIDRMSVWTVLYSSIDIWARRAH